MNFEFNGDEHGEDEIKTREHKFLVYCSACIWLNGAILGEKR